MNEDNKNAILINPPLTSAQARKLKAGDKVLISGVIYTGRDAAHQRMIQALDRGEDLPFDVKNQIIYFMGPSPAPEGKVIGSAGPTTSGRMDAYSPSLIACGLTGMIGKGLRSPQVVAAMQEYGAVYFGAIGGAGALLSTRIKEAEVIAWPDLGAEAVCRLVVENFPVVVLIDSDGNNLYETGREKYKNS